MAEARPPAPPRALYAAPGDPRSRIRSTRAPDQQLIPSQGPESPFEKSRVSSTRGGGSSASTAMKSGRRCGLPGVDGRMPPASTWRPRIACRTYTWRSACSAEPRTPRPCRGRPRSAQAAPRRRRPDPAAAGVTPSPAVPPPTPLPRSAPLEHLAGRVGRRLVEEADLTRDLVAREVLLHARWTRPLLRRRRGPPYGTGRAHRRTPEAFAAARPAAPHELGADPSRRRLRPGRSRSPVRWRR
jgi:hypothetical protein